MECRNAEIKFTKPTNRWLDVKRATRNSHRNTSYKRHVRRNAKTNTGQKNRFDHFQINPKALSFRMSQGFPFLQLNNPLYPTSS